MKSRRKMEQINQILKDLYYSADVENVDLTYGMVYNYLIKYGVSGKDERGILKKKFFSLWQYNFRNKKNIRVFCSENWRYFCQFINGDVNYDCVKVYVPLDYHHIYRGANLIFEFLEKNNIKHRSKIGSDVRFDDVVIRLNSLEDANKLQNFIDNDAYIQKGLMNANPFAFSNNGINYAFDGVLSYNSCVAKIIACYIRDMKSKRVNINDINVSSFCNYVDKFGKDRYKVMSLAEDSSFDTAIGYASLVVDLIKLSLNSNDMKDYCQYYNKVCNINKFGLSYQIQNDDNTNLINNEKEELLKELILTTMKKYPRGYDENNPEYSGFDYISTFLNGDIRGVTRTNNLRDRVQANLSVDDVYSIVEHSGVLGNNIYDKLDNYIMMVMLNEIIRCMNIRMPYNVERNLNGFMRNNNFSYITNSVGQARCLAYTMDASMMRQFLNNLGVRNISEYIKNYYNNNQNMSKRR